MATPKLKLGNDKWATKQKSLLAFNDEGNNFKSLPFNVERLSGGSYVGRNGLIQYAATEEPRIDFTNYSKGALLLEPQRTNSITYSEDFSDGSYNKNNATVTTNNTTAPDGTTNADKITSTGTAPYARVTFTHATLTSYTVSIFAKKGDENYLYIRALALSSQPIASFNLSTGSLGTVNTGLTAEMQSYNNGWYRCIIKYTTTSSISNNLIDFGFASSDNSRFSSSGKFTYFWGAQIETGDYSTSYIPTAGSAATRIADLTENNSIPGDLINSTEGTLFIDFEYLYQTTTDPATDAFRDIFVIGSTTDLSENISFDNYRSGFRVYVNQDIGYLALGTSIAGSSQPNTRYKLAVKYKTGDCKAYLNGSLLGSSTGTVNLATPLTGIFFSYNSGGRPYKNQKRVYDLQYFNTALTDAELQTLTTL